MQRGFLSKEYKYGRTLGPPPPTPPPKERHGMEHDMEDPAKLLEGLDRARTKIKEEKAREVQAEEKRVNPPVRPDLKTTMKEIFKRFHATGYICFNSFRLQGRVHSVFVFVDEEAKASFVQKLVPLDNSELLRSNRLVMRSLEAGKHPVMVLDKVGDAGNPLLVECPLLCLPEFSPDDEKVSASYEELLGKIVSRLSPERRTQFTSLRNAWRGDGGPVVRGRGEYAGIVDTNGIAIVRVPTDNVISYRGIFATLSRVKHSCRPNVCLHWDSTSGLMSVRAIRTIAAEEEITFSYLTSRQLLLPAAKRRAELQRKYHFMCMCPACDGSPEEIAASDARRAELARTPAPRSSAWFRWGGNAGLAREAAEYSESYLLNQSRRMWELYEREGLIEPPDGVDCWSHAAQFLFCYLALAREHDAQFWARKVLERAIILEQDPSSMDLVFIEARAAVVNPKEAISWNARKKLALALDELEARNIF